MSSLPEGWVEKPLAEIAILNMGQSPDSNTYNDKGDGLLFLQGCGDFGSKYPEGKTYCSVPGKVAGEGDVLISVRAPVADMNSADQRYCIGRGLAAISGVEVESSYLRYLIEQNVAWLKQRGQGSTFEAIGSTDLKEFILPFPIEFKERQKIAKILNTVDNLIEKTQTLIEKYTSIKQGMMADLFTRGIDMTTGDSPNSKGGKLRPSVEDAHELYKQTELGWVSKEWGGVEIDEICTQMTNGFVGVATPFYANKSEVGVRYLYGNNVRANKLELHKVLTIKPEFHERLRKSQLKRGDMLTVQSGHIGTSAVVPDNFGEANCHALIITRFIQSRVIPEFVSYYLNSAIGMNRMEEIFVGSTIKHVNVKELKEFEIPLPSLEEQERFISRIDQALSLISSEEAQLKKLKNQKKGLMQDLLTGKVRVN